MNFTKTELEVLRLLIQGLTIREVAKQRGGSLHQVEHHIRILRLKTGTKTLFDLGYKLGRLGPKLT